MTNFDLTGSSILITGGTGSFGRSFAKLLLEKYNPRRLVIFSRDELKQFEMAQEINGPNVRYFIGDIRDVNRLRTALYDIDVVVHAAALKQVPAAEYNPIECIRTNINGGENVITACIDAGVKRVIALSTDKAVGPINLYGATKLCSDKLFIAANHYGVRSGTKFSVVRYGNVVGSRGSVIPFFKKLRPTGRLPITDPAMTRFWITLEQGTAFVTRCLQIMQGGEVFVSKIPSMRIVDLADAVAPECEKDIVGIRPGEKLHEMMVPQDEAIRTLEYNDFYMIKPALTFSAQDPDRVYDGEVGRPVAPDFEYASDNNTQWITKDQLSEIIKD